MAKELPISFTAESVRAIIDKRKNVTRRVIKNIPACYVKGRKPQSYGPDDYAFLDMADPVGTYPTLAMPRYQPGDLLWVKESYREAACNKGFICIQYKADEQIRHGLTSQGDNGEIEAVGKICEHGLMGGGKWKSSRFMPKWVARTWLEVVSVRPEQLQDITEEDCWKEGINKQEADKLPYINKWGVGCASATFSNLWDSINTKRGYSWESNPFVWRIEFREARRQ